MLALSLVLCALVGYIIGAIPVGVLISDYHRVDIGKQGSGKTGTTNVLRSIGRRAALLVLIGDVLKGALAVLLARWLVSALVPANETLQLMGTTFSLWTAASLAAAFGSVFGHVWSLFLRLFQGRWNGGRGVATGLGAVLVVNPLIVLVAAAVGIPTMIISRYVSLGSILGAVAGGLALIALVVLGQMDALSLLFIFVPIFVIAAHKDNIERLLKGTERKLGEKARA